MEERGRVGVPTLPAGYGAASGAGGGGREFCRGEAQGRAPLCAVREEVTFEDLCLWIPDAGPGARDVVTRRRSGGAVAGIWRKFGRSPCLSAAPCLEECACGTASGLSLQVFFKD